MAKKQESGSRILASNQWLTSEEVQYYRIQLLKTIHHNFGNDISQVAVYKVTKFADLLLIIHVQQPVDTKLWIVVWKNEDWPLSATTTDNEQGIKDAIVRVLQGGDFKVAEENTVVGDIITEVFKQI